MNQSFEGEKRSFEDVYNEVFADVIKVEEAKRARGVDSELDHLLKIQDKEWALEPEDREMFLRICGGGPLPSKEEVDKYAESITLIDDEKFSEEEEAKLKARLSMMSYVVKEFLLREKELLAKYKTKVLNGKP